MLSNLVNGGFRRIALVQHLLSAFGAFAQQAQLRTDVALRSSCGCSGRGSLARGRIGDRIRENLGRCRHVQRRCEPRLGDRHRCIGGRRNALLEFGQREHEFVGILESLRRVLGHRPIDQRLPVREVLRQSRHGFEHVRVRDRETVVALVRRLAGQCLEADGAERIQIGAAVDIAAARLLGTHVVAGTDADAGIGDARGLADGTCDAEVGQHRIAVRVEQHVARRDVAMHEAALVGETERARDSCDHAQHFAFADAVADAMQEIAVRQMLHREVVQLFVGDADVVDGDDVRMRERSQRARFLHEAARERRVGNHRRVHHLQRDFALERCLYCQEHRGHAAGTDFSLDQITRNLDHAAWPGR